ncbi:MAG: sugar transferase [Paludibacter sp.]|nr:sugar transferase [Paludibacter sp.]
MKIFYKPTFKYLIIDLTMSVLWIFVILQWFPLTTNTPFEKYFIPALYYLFTWAIWSYFIGRYQPLRKQYYYKSTLKLFYISLSILIFFHVLIFIYFFNTYSHNLLYTATAGGFTLNYIFLTVYFSYKYAIEYEEIIIIKNDERINSKVKAGQPLDENSKEVLYSSIRAHSGEITLNFLKKNVRLEEGNAFVYASTDSDVLKYMPRFQFSTIIQLEKLNGIKGINKMLSNANAILPENGIFVCCFQSKSTYKKLMLKGYAKGLNYLVYSVDFLMKRVFPKLVVSRWFYYVFSGCKNRILSKAEVLGRLYCCGYSVEMEKKIGQLTYVFARRITKPEIVLKRTYGPLISLKRLGKDAKYFDVYKMRTMHPYSEFLQAYIYEKNSLKEGGKFNKDIRVTTLGKFMRKFWLDELPMIINLLKGEMKLVGVRPLSAHYFSLYSKELQEKRVKFKPGLLPPFYADMPKTLDEIQASEMKYLILCESNNELKTDFLYLILILRNIFIKKARSA